MPFCSNTLGTYILLPFVLTNHPKEDASNEAFSLGDRVHRAAMQARLHVLLG